MAKKSHQLVNLINEENPSTGTKYIIKKPTRGLKASVKMRFRKYDPVLKRHCWFVEKKLHARVMGTRADIKEKASGKCLICEKKANVVIYAGKSY